MTEPVSPLKTIVGTFTAAVVAPATADALRAAERIILGVPQSVLLVAMAGALIGVLLLPEKDAERVAADAGRRAWAPLVADRGALGSAGCGGSRLRGRGRMDHLHCRVRLGQARRCTAAAACWPFRRSDSPDASQLCSPGGTSHRHHRRREAMSLLIRFFKAL